MAIDAKVGIDVDTTPEVQAVVTDVLNQLAIIALRDTALAKNSSICK